MGYSANDTAQKHQRILNESIRLFRERGFSGVSVSEVMKAAGLTHGPFYNHFASKEELMAEALAYGVARSAAGVEALAADKDVKDAKARYVEDYLSAAHRDAPGSGCSFAALSAEVRQEPQVRGPFTAHLKAAVQHLTRWLPWKSKRTARGDAITTMAALLGAIILARAVDDSTFSDEIL